MSATVDTVILTDDEVKIARIAIRRSLTAIRHSYRANVRDGLTHYAAADVEKFDATLDLYERLGGDIDLVADIEAGKS